MLHAIGEWYVNGGYWLHALLNLPLGWISASIEDKTGKVVIWYVIATSILISIIFISFSILL